MDNGTVDISFSNTDNYDINSSLLWAKNITLQIRKWSDNAMKF